MDVGKQSSFNVHRLTYSDDVLYKTTVCKHTTKCTKEKNWKDEHILYPPWETFFLPLKTMQRENDTIKKWNNGPKWEIWTYLND